MSPCVDCVNKAHCKIRGGSKPCPAYISPPVTPAKLRTKDIVYQTGIIVSREVVPIVLKAFVQ